MTAISEPLAIAAEQSMGPGAIDLPCCVPGCGKAPSERCGYVDAKGRSCLTCWCAVHGEAIGGLRYCRRHAGIMSALGSKANNPRALPDIGNRGPSLVHWVYRDLNSAIVRLLEKFAGPEEHLLRDSEVVVARDADGGRRWEMSWKLASPAKVRIRITLFVAEENDSVINVRVGDEVVASGIPPWIQARRQGVQLTDDVDIAQRRDFYGFLENFLAESLSS
ncbi:MAG: hypothetical protein M3R48_08630 [Candidatus Dormibacteraeota bacterium]|nr:hypothetical protein [Candidatus Dormibacteraeota bacterium]